jgi:flagellar biosynthesis protein FlhB
MTEPSSQASEERSEAPTPRRLEQARQQGQIAVSRELIGGAVALGTFVVLVLQGPALLGELVAYLRLAFADAARIGVMDVSLRRAGKVLCVMLSVPLAAIVLVAIVVGLAQTRGAWSSARLRDGNRGKVLSLRRVFRREGFLLGLVGVLKLVALGAVSWWVMRPWIGALVGLSGNTPVNVLRAFGKLAAQLAVRLAATLLIFGFIDYLWQRHRHRRALRMSPSEVRQEHKEHEGEPIWKMARRRLHRELVTESAWDDVARADFVLVDPGVAGRAIGYDRSGSNAPIVLVRANGANVRHLEDLACTTGIPVFVEPMLVRRLARNEEGDEIPEVLYEDIATLLLKSDRLREQASVKGGIATGPGSDEDLRS